MSGASTNRIWGLPNVALGSIRKPTPAKATLREPSVSRSLFTFLSEQIERWQPDFIVVVERKGTAILRALKELPLALEWPWEKVISSVCIDQVDPELLRGRRVLVFDDMMRTGHHLGEVLCKLEQHFSFAAINCQVRVAVFAVHESQSTGLEWNGRPVPDVAFFRELTSNSYRNVGSQIIEFLQRAGSLMLDTEHLEVRFRLNGGMAQLAEAFRRRADVVVFHSLSDRTNLTVVYPEDDAHRLDEGSFPAGTTLTGVVRKCRIVQRQHNDFAIIPICYPAVPAHGEWSPGTEPAFIRSDSVRPGLQVFYAAALVAALKVLEWAIRDLAVAGSSLTSLELPTSPSTANHTGYDLEHLRVMHPYIDTSQVVEAIATLAARATSDGVRLRRRKHEPHKPTLYSDKELHTDSVRLLQLIRLVLDDRQFEEPDAKGGLLPGDVFELGRRCGWSSIKTSALFDILIDDAQLVPHTERLKCDGQAYWTRTFEPDGEMVSDLVRHYTTQWGLPKGY